LPWMAFGYNVLVTPLHTCMLYNAIANNGVMMRPYLLNSVSQEGHIVQQKQPASIESICDSITLKQLQECLVGVCKDSGATAFRLFKGTTYAVAGKTGTALVANGKHGYADHIYQSSFAGYFPAQNPQYTCVVVIKNKPHAKLFYGASVAGPVFKEIADRLVTLNTPLTDDIQYAKLQSKDSNSKSYTGFETDMRSILSNMNIRYKDSARSMVAKMFKQQDKTVLTGVALNNKNMPALNGLGLKDALYICENAGLVVKVRGVGKVTNQSIAEGSPIAKGQLIKLDLN